jgi:hypothetical protein
MTGKPEVTVVTSHYRPFRQLRTYTADGYYLTAVRTDVDAAQHCDYDGHNT